MEKSKEETGESNLLTVTAADGTGVRAEVEGEGRVILILHPGMDTGKSYAPIAARLGKQYRVMRLHRRQYRQDLKADPVHGSPCTVAEEVEHVLALVRAADEPVLLFGHSSGATVALEALVASPASFVGAMVYEPASVIESAGGLHLAGDQIERNGEVGEGLRQARQALVSGKPGAAIGLFTSLITGWPGFVAHPAGALTALFPLYRGLIPCQIDDLEAMERLGIRLDAYSRLNLPVAMVYGERSPDFNKKMVAAVIDALPDVERVPLSGQGHSCNIRDPQKLAAVMETFARKVFAETLL